MICLVTDRRRLSPGPEAVDRLVEVAGAAARAGIDLIQLRERDLDARGLAVIVSRCVAAVDGTKTKVLVNDRADVAAVAGAHGVHLRADSIAAPAARTLLGPELIVGRSVHALTDARAALRAGGVDYLIFGTLYPTPSKEQGHPMATLDELGEVCRAAREVPVLAIGGITVQRAAEVARAGAAGIAAIGLFVPRAGISADEHLQSVVWDLRRSFDTCGVVT
jgi:thiamine-phosphate pyrophosphorylase